MKHLDIFVGYDQDIRTDFDVLSHSIRARTKSNVRIHKLPQHDDMLSRPWDQHQTTSFSFTRFLVPSLVNYAGMAVFMDPDMLCLCDISELLSHIDSSKPIHVVKHQYIPQGQIKYVGKSQCEQHHYDRKNWSSLMVFNAELCRDYFNLDTIETHSGLSLHGFQHVPNHLIGELPLEYNYLVGESNQSTIGAKIVHFTNGMPYVVGHEHLPYSYEWFVEYEDMVNSERIY